MNFFSNVSLLVLQPQGQLDLEASSFQVLLEEALRQSVATVVIDLVAIAPINSAGIEALKTASRLVFAAGKELVIYSADPVTRAALEVERDRQQSQQFGKRTEVVAPNFQQFLTCSAIRQDQPTSLKSAPQAHPNPVKLPSVTPVLTANSYTSEGWGADHPVRYIA